MRLFSRITLASLGFVLIFLAIYLMYPKPKSEKCCIELPFLKNIEKTFQFFDENVDQLYADVFLVPVITLKAIEKIQKVNIKKNLGSDVDRFITLKSNISSLLSLSLAKANKTEYNRKFMKLFELDWAPPEKLEWLDDHDIFAQDPKPASEEVDYLNENFEDNCLENLLSNKCDSGSDSKLEVSKRCWDYNTDVSTGLNGYELTHKILYVLIALKTNCYLPYLGYKDTDIQTSEGLLAFFSGRLILSLREANESLKKTRDVVMIDLVAETLVMGLLLGNSFFHDARFAKHYADIQHESGCYADMSRFEVTPPFSVKSRSLLMEKQLPNRCRLHLTSVSSLFLILYTYYQVISNSCFVKNSQADYKILMQVNHGAIIILFICVLCYLLKDFVKRISSQSFDSKFKRKNFSS